MSTLSNINGSLIIFLLYFLSLLMFTSVNGDDGRDLFSSTEDMKTLFLKEAKLTGKEK